MSCSLRSQKIAGRQEQGKRRARRHNRGGGCACPAAGRDLARELVVKRAGSHLGFEALASPPWGLNACATGGSEVQMSFRYMSLLAIAAPLAGCFLLTEPVDSLVLEVSVAPPAFRIGDSATVVVTLRNPTSDTIRYQTDGCPPRFAAYDAAGRQVAPAGIACPDLHFLRELAAGEERVYRFTWLGEPWTNSRPQGRPYPSEFLVPGTYTVRGVLPLDSGQRLSGPITVQLLPRD
jgi:hypothetical protein